MKWLKRMFCKHDYEKIAFRQEIKGGERYSVRRYICTKCGKEIWVDGRFDIVGG